MPILPGIEMFTEVGVCAVNMIIDFCSFFVEKILIPHFFSSLDFFPSLLLALFIGISQIFASYTQPGNILCTWDKN